MITIVLSYYQNGLMLDRHFEEWNQYERKASYRFVIVDDGSPTDPAINHIKDIGLDLRVYRIRENIAWNIPGARNLGMHHAPDGWCLLTDIDHVLLKDDATRLANDEKKLAPGHFYFLQRRWASGQPLNPHGNSYLLQRSDYWRIGGTDEDFSGWWGAGERAFRANLRKIANKIDLQSVYLTHFGRHDIPDASTRDWTSGPPAYERRGTQWDWTKNEYLVKKATNIPYKAENPLRFDWERVA